jgi:hypothetical protein
MIRLSPVAQHMTAEVIARALDGRRVGYEWLTQCPAGSGKARIAPQKMMLGPCRGEAVRLARGFDCNDMLLGQAPRLGDSA